MFYKVEQEDRLLLSKSKINNNNKKFRCCESKCKLNIKILLLKLVVCSYCGKLRKK